MMIGFLMLGCSFMLGYEGIFGRLGNQIGVFSQIVYLFGIVIFLIVLDLVLEVGVEEVLIVCVLVEQFWWSEGEVEGV